MTGQRGRLIAFRNDRLGARLISLINTLRLSAVHKLPCKVHWPEATDIGQVFNDPTELFEDSFVAQHFIDRAEWVRRRPGSERIAAVGREGPGHLRALIDAGTDVTIDQAFGIQVLAGEDPAQVKRDFVRVVQQLPFAAALHQPIAKVHAELTGATAYHIRRGDLTSSLKAMNKPWPHKMVPNEFYEAHIERALAQGTGRAIVFSDDAETLSHYRTKFPRLTTIQDIVDIDALTEAQRDLLELYAMSCCAKIIAPERSAFSSTACDLGDAIKLDVTEDLSEDLIRKAYERLASRLRDRPESFAGDGEIGQCLAHVAEFLEREERWADGADLISHRIESGLNIAFAYPMAMRFQHRVGDVAGVLRTGDLMMSRHVVNARYYVDAVIQHGYGLVRAGRTEEGLRQILNGFWHSPTSATSRLLVPALVETGMLHAQNFLPVSALQLGLRRRRGPLRALVSEFPEMIVKSGTPLPNTVGELESAIWDWMLLLRGVSIKALVQKGDVARMRDMLHDAEVRPEEEAERNSLIALCDALEGESKVATERLWAMAKPNSEDFMVWQRLSHACWLSRDYAGAAESSARAVALAPDVPAMLAWDGMIALRTRAVDRALEHLLRADAADIGFASIPALLAQAYEADGQPEMALGAIERAAVLSSIDPEFAMCRARLLDDLKRPEEAIEVLQVLVENLRATGRVFIQLVELLNRTGHRARAVDTVRIGQERYPSHPAMQRLAEENAV